MSPEAELFYLQDSRTFVGNDLMFWAAGGNGYTTDLSKAHVFTRAEALSKHAVRPTDIPWPKAYMDARTRPAVDFQYVKIKDALAGTGIVLVKEKPPKATAYRTNCHQCGCFVRFPGICKNCCADNRP